MEIFKNVIKLDLEQALKPNVEELSQYDCILLPREFYNGSSQTIQLMYRPLKNVYYYDKY